MKTRLVIAMYVTWGFNYQLVLETLYSKRQRAWDTTQPSGNGRQNTIAMYGDPKVFLLETVFRSVLLGLVPGLLEPGPVRGELPERPDHRHMPRTGGVEERRAAGAAS